MIHTDDGDPCGCTVTVLAHIRRQRMRRPLAGRIRAVVTADAVAGDRCVIEVRRYPGHGRMAVVAVVTTRDVCRILARRNRAVVTREASADYLCVVDDISRLPHDVVMAILTHVGRKNMRRSLASRIDAVVTTDAIAHDVDVIEVRGNPGGRRMAIVAVVATRDVSRVLTGCGRIVVTGETGANDLRMVDGICRRPVHIVVAILADIGRQHMRRALAGRIDAVVAADAVAGDADVIEICRNPGGCRMAVVAVVAALDVRRVLAGRCRAVVA